MASSFVYTGIPLNLMHNNNHDNKKKYTFEMIFFFFFFFFWFVDCCFWFTPVDFLCIQGEQLQSDFIFSTLCTPPKFSFLFFYHFFLRRGEGTWLKSFTTPRRTIFFLVLRAKKQNKNNSRLSRSRCVRLFKRPIERNHLVKYDFKIISLKQQIASTFATMMSAAFDFFSF